MEKKNSENEKGRIRKEYAPKGHRNQTPMTFRCDNDLLEWLSNQANKGRYINDLIRQDKGNRV